MEYSKSLLEVLEWKELAYNDIKDLNSEERMKFYSENSEQLLNEMGYRKKRIAKNAYILEK